MNDKLPTVVSTYAKAIVDNNIVLFDECFADDAVVADNGKTYTGITAVKEWGDELSQMTLTTKITSVESDGSTAQIKTYVEGDFKSSPLPFIYDLVLKNEKIQSIDIRVDK